MVTMSMNGVTLCQNRCILYDTSRLDQLKIIKQAIAISKNDSKALCDTKPGSHFIGSARYRSITSMTDSGTRQWSVQQTI